MVLVEIALLTSLAVIVREFAFFIAFFGYAVTGPLTWLKRRLVRKPAPVPGAPPRDGNAP
ncbi:hypothetical protein D3C83_319250 [compost metagenome]